MWQRIITPSLALAIATVVYNIYQAVRKAVKSAA